MNPAGRRALLRACFDAAVAAVSPGEAVRRHLRVDGGDLVLGAARFPLAGAGRVILVGAGKASAGMAQAVEGILGDRIARGLVVVKDGHALPLARVRCCASAHPVPDARSLAAGAELLAAVRGLGSEDLVLCCLSGGASALVDDLRPPLGLDDLRAATSALLAGGADIQAVNAVRRRCSRLKGGGLARAARPARVWTLAISDVPGDAWAAIGSGPTLPEPLSADLALATARAAPGMPATVLEVLAAGADEPAQAEDARDVRVLVANNRQAQEAAAACARVAGQAVRILPGLDGFAAVRGRSLAAEALALAASGWRGVLVAGGETTVRLEPGHGLGGRNQELALAAALVLDRQPGEAVTLLAAGSDGGDGPTDAAGAYAEAGLGLRCPGRDPAAHLARHDAYPLLDAAGDLLRTGPTGTNVSDLALVAIG